MSVNRSLLVFAAAALVASVATGQSPRGVGPFTDSSRWVHFTRSSGLPSDFASGLVDVPGDGPWALTRAGVARFDGFVWRAVPIAGEQAAPTCLVPDGQGGLVLVAGGRLVTGNASGLRVVGGNRPGEAVPARGCARAKKGPVLVLDGDHLLEWDGTRVRAHLPAQALGKVASMFQAGTTSVWISTETGLWCWEGERWRRRLAGRRLGLAAVFETADESAIAYVDTPRSARGLWEWHGESEPRPVLHPVGTPVLSIVIGPRGETLLAHDTGDLVARQGDEWVPIEQSGSSVVGTRAIGLLGNGDFWMASDQGISVYRRSATLWRRLAIPRPDARNTVNAIVALPSGRLVLGTGRGVVEASVDAPPADRPIHPEDDIGTITGLATDARGRLWATSGYSFTGAKVREGSGPWRQARLGPEFDSALLHRAVTDRLGNVWFLGLSRDADDPTDGPGAFRLVVSLDRQVPDRLEPWGQAQGLPRGRVYAFAEGPDGTRWFGTSAGLSRWRNGQWRHWSESNGLRRSRVFCLALDHDGGVWFGHQVDGGVGHLADDRITYTSPNDNLATQGIWEVQVDGRNRPWAAGEGGVSVLRDGVWTAFGPQSGLTNSRFWPVLPLGDSVCLGSRGGGLAVLNTSEQVTPPPIVVADPPALDESGALLRWRAFAWWGELSPDSVQTRLRLDDGHWTEWSTERSHRLANLSAGAHTVAFETKGLLGTISGAQPAVRFAVPPPLVARPLFYIPVSSLTLLVTALVAALGVRQRRHHLAIHEREEQLARTFQASPVATAIVRVEDHRLVEANEAMTKLTGRSRARLLDDTIDALAADILPDTLLALPAADGPLTPVSLRIRDTGGETHEVYAYTESVEYGGTRALLVQMLDVTDLRRLEQQLRQAQKLESIGRLAGGVAHDFNNLLTVIVGNADLLDTELPTGDPRHGEVEQIKIAGDRAERLTRQLLAFARKQVVEPRVVNINDSVVGTERMLRRVIGEDVEFVTLTAPDLECVLIDPAQLEQVLMNMAVNARDAMPSGGTLTIRTRNVRIGEREARLQPGASAGRFVRLSVSDTGIGMDASTRARVFEPFFTTKEPGKGTGLGLATCYGIIRQAGGHILVDSAPGQGATFHVDLPPTSADCQPTTTRDRQADTGAGAETVMLVEDEVQVRALAATVLRSRGYHVIEAGTGAEALQLSAQYHGSLDILVTDVVMPHMRGAELARRLQAERPGLRVLYVSGYTNDDQFREEAGSDLVSFLGKPFAPAALCRKVREVLDE